MLRLNGWKHKALSLAIGLAVLAVTATGCATTGRSASNAPMSKHHATLHTPLDSSGVQFPGEASM
jgi:hypothetical protein